MTITALPSLDRTDPTFREDVDLFFSTQLPAFSVEVEAARVEINSNTGIATTKAGEALTSANTATTKAGEALTSANAASVSAGSALASKNAAEAALDAFDDKYLGSKASDPTLDNDGNPLQDGAFYINSVSGYIRVYTAGTGWVQGIAAIAGVSSVNGLTGAVSGIATTANITSERTSVATLTNKTMTAVTNNIEARSLKSATTTVSVSAAAAPTVGQVLTATSGTAATWQSPSSSSIGDHNVRVSTDNGYGSTNTKIRRFSTVVRNVGTAITYADSATLGASFLINEDGIYAVTAVTSGLANEMFGVTINSSELTTSFSSVAPASRIVFSGVGTEVYKSASITRRFTTGDVLRYHTNGVAGSANLALEMSITKVSV